MIAIKKRASGCCLSPADYHSDLLPNKQEEKAMSNYVDLWSNDQWRSIEEQSNR